MVPLPPLRLLFQLQRIHHHHMLSFFFTPKTFEGAARSIDKRESMILKFLEAGDGNFQIDSVR